jgi:truncated hemoglobin YjbI
MRQVRLVPNSDHPKFPTHVGYMSEHIRRDYIASAIAQNLLPSDAHRMADIVSLVASDDMAKPIQFWQLYSVLGQDPIVRIVQGFYERVFADEDWFTSVFARVGGIGHHVNTQASMWIDVMGGGPYYHGGEFRLNFHHTHNAMQLMTDKGAARWAHLMIDTLDNAAEHMGHDPRVRPGINTFLTHFMGKYAQEFAFENRSVFGETNPAYRRKINFLKMTAEAIEALPEAELSAALQERGVDVSQYSGKAELVNKALMI